jgi:hypothetical protein
MNERERYLDRNTAHLIRAALGPHARPSARAADQTFRLLLDQLRTRSSEVAFPDAAVGVLGTTLVLAATWLTAQVTITGTSPFANPSLLMMSAWAVTNLALLPVASIVILIRRQRE